MNLHRTLFRSRRWNFTVLICFASLAFAYLVQETKNRAQIDSKQRSVKNRHYTGKTAAFQFRTCLLATTLKTDYF